MTSANDDRPVPRTRAHAAPDEDRDPIDPPPTPRGAAQGTSEPPARRKAEPTVQLGSRIAVSVDDILTDAIRRTGSTKRDLIEHAIRTTYPDN